MASSASPRTPLLETLGTAAGDGAGVDVGGMAGRVPLCRGAGESGGGFVAVWLGGTAGAGGDVLGTPLVGVFGWLVGVVPFRAGVTAGGVATAEFSVVGGRGLDDTILSRWLPPPPPQAARSATKAVDVVSRLSECLAAMMCIHCATKCTELVMEQSYSWRGTVVDASIKKHQCEQATGGSVARQPRWPPLGSGGRRFVARLNPSRRVCDRGRAAGRRGGFPGGWR